MPRKLREWRARQEACPRATRWWAMWPWGLRGRPENYITLGRFLPGGTKKKTDRRAAKRYAAMGAGLASDCPCWEVKKNMRCTRLSKAENQGETKIIWCLGMALARLPKVEKQVETKIIRYREIMPNWQKHRSKEKLRRFSVSRWPCTSFAKAERRIRGGSLWLSPSF